MITTIRCDCLRRGHLMAVPGAEMLFRTVLVFIVLLCAVSAAGGMRLERSNGIQVSIEGMAYRIDLPTSSEPREFDAVVSLDGDATATCINYGNRTWFEKRRAAPDPGGKSPYSFALEKAPDIDVHEEAGEEISGHATRKHSVRVRLSVIQTIRQNKVRFSIDAMIVLWTAPDLPQVIKPSLQTGYPAADETIAAILAKIAGLSLRETTSFTRSYEGGQPVTTTAEWTTTSITSKTIPESMFQVPKEFVHQFPQYEAPSK